MRRSTLILGLTALTSAISGFAVGALLRLLFEVARPQKMVLPSARDVVAILVITALGGLVAWRFFPRFDYGADLAAYFSAPNPPPPPARGRLASAQALILVVPFLGAAAVAATVLSGVLAAGAAMVVATITRLTIGVVMVIVDARISDREAERSARTKITP